MHPSPHQPASHGANDMTTIGTASYTADIGDGNETFDTLAEVQRAMRSRVSGIRSGDEWYARMRSRHGAKVRDAGAKGRRERVLQRADLEAECGAEGVGSGVGGGVFVRALMGYRARSARRRGAGCWWMPHKKGSRHRLGKEFLACGVAGGHKGGSRCECGPRRRGEVTTVTAPVQRREQLANLACCVDGSPSAIWSRLASSVGRCPTGTRSMQDEILTLPELAQLLKVAEKTVYTMAQKGELPAFKVGGQWRFRRDDIDAWIERQKLGPKGTK
jgi:excisionase family DNA binding protein